ncbi:MAG: hypothetical protein CBC55_12560 [Gammaproteobacteria bacterium TMED95]|jgi:CDP-4-dehydro-6-deoxyglucose reductase|nr:CDP-6-deoxy-delta-3,4-glucoseen reductase [Gammaproteobacteria bacterium]OUV19248.1 MAG: hypothetical protein CBC55_12560 [Gammaproteobacteria bacterium TMED95]|tara:strand:- start:713 stop:1411 length:699 start_codon:yes stop_codon:yes gene_type:complete
MPLELQVLANEFMTETIRRLVLALPEDAPTYHPGQYLTLHFGDASYPFSIANPPGDDHLELHIAATPNSRDSDHIEQSLNLEPTAIPVSFPLGDCFLAACPEKPVILVAAATGITQMKCLNDWLHAREFAQAIHLYWGVREPTELYLHNELEALARIDGFTYTPVVSDNIRQWSGRTGLVGDAVTHDIQDLNDYLVFVSGSPGMVYGTLDQFIASGFDAKNMRSDVFSYAPR